jgi:hypothetical protein
MKAMKVFLVTRLVSCALDAQNDRIVLIAIRAALLSHADLALENLA